MLPPPPLPPHGFSSSRRLTCCLHALFVGEKGNRHVHVHVHVRCGGRVCLRGQHTEQGSPPTFLPDPYRITSVSKSYDLSGKAPAKNIYSAARLTDEKRAGCAKDLLLLLLLLLLDVYGCDCNWGSGRRRSAKGSEDAYVRGVRG